MKSYVILNEDSPMPWGRYLGVKMKDLPKGYLIYLYDNRMCGGNVLRYILDNMEALRNELKNNK